jgi:hypothetical protein
VSTEKDEEKSAIEVGTDVEKNEKDQKTKANEDKKEVRTLPVPIFLHNFSPFCPGGEDVIFLPRRIFLIITRIMSRACVFLSTVFQLWFRNLPQI